MRRLLIAAIALLLVGGCSRNAPGDPGPMTEGARVYLEVTNNFALAVEVSAVSAGINQRLGMVHPGMQAHFTLPQALINGRQIEFVVAPSASTTQYRSAEMILYPGEIVDLQVAAVLFNSTTVIRP
jgi:hypothetical protein